MSHPDLGNLPAVAAEQLNSLKDFLSFVPHWTFRQFINLPHGLIGLFTGNQYGKSNGAMYSYILRFLGIHPVVEKNVLYFECEKCGRTYWDSVLSNLVTDAKQLARKRPAGNICPHCLGKIQIHKRESHVFRMYAEVLPGEKGDKDSDRAQAEVKNTLYPALKKWMPSFLLKKDITFRNPAMTIYNINDGVSFDGLLYDGMEIVVEFMSYNQAVQAGAGVQRCSVYFDEEPPYEIYEEQLPRLLQEDGDIIIGLTPANRMTWTYDIIYEHAAVIIRSKTICDYLKANKGEDFKQIETTDSEHDVAVIHAATDDNPTLSPKAISRIYSNFDDPDVIAIRRYGIHHQVQGRIFKDFDARIHIVSAKKYFEPEDNYQPPDIGGWIHGRFIDYHEHNPWAITWMAKSPDNELFVYNEWNPSPDQFVTNQIAREVISMSGDKKYPINLIDPLAAKKQSNTGTTVIEDMNRYFREGKRENRGTGGYWESWDTKSTVGRDSIRQRLKNSVKCGKPFNNTQVVDGRERKLPTIWFFSNCRTCIKSVRNWRLEEWGRDANVTNKDRKETPAQKWSHFPMTIEAAEKDIRFRPRKAKKHSSKPKYKKFKGKRR